MFLNVENLTIEQLLEKQIELRKRMTQANSMGMMGPVAQLQNMLDQVSIEVQAKSQMQAIDKDRERKIENGTDPDDDVLNIG